MTKAKKIILLSVAAALIVGGIAAAVFALTSDAGKNNGDSSADETTGTVHADTEYIYDEDGTVKSEIYYKDDEYIGRKDFFSEGKKQYVTEFDADGNETFASVTELNAAGSISLITTYKNKELYSTVEYIYFDDMRTLSKKTTKTYEGETEFAEKILYNEKGEKIQVSKYENGTLVEGKLFEENGGDTGEK